MKRLLQIACGCLFILLAAPAYAGGISFSPSAASVEVGQQVSFQVIADGQGDPMVVSQFDLSYPSDLLTPVSFTFAPGWVQTFDVGTNVMASGTVIKSGAYTATFEGPEVMGTLTFTAEQTGVATIALSNDNTYLFEGDNGGNFFDGNLSSAQTTITPGADGETSIAQPTAQTVAPSSAAAATVQSTNGISFTTIATWAAFVLIALIILWILYRLMRRKRKRRRRFDR